MGIRKYKPTTPGRRGASGSDFSELTRTEPEKSLVRPLHSQGGRNVLRPDHHPAPGRRAQARVPADRLPRADKDGVPAKVAHIEYDPNRTARIALLHYADGEKRYIIAPVGLQQGDRVENGAGADIKAGQLPAAAQHPDRHGRARHRAAARRRRQDRPVGRVRRPAAGQGGQPRHAAHAVRRDPAGGRGLPGHGR